MAYAVGDDHKKLIEDGDKLFSKRQSLESLWQEIASEFYVEMADFTVTRYLGDEFADHLTTSYPLIARRTLGDSLSALLRPVNLDSTSPGVWFSMRADDERREDQSARSWLEFATGVQRRAMYDRKSNFVRATKEGDHSFATFGQTPISLELNRNRDGLLYRCWHLRDVAWSEGSDGQIDAVYRKWKPEAHQLAQTFGNNVAPEAKSKAEKDPYCKIDVCHIVIDTERYVQRGKSFKRYRTPWVSVWIDKTHNWVMEEVGSWSRIYVIPRWVTIPGSQYASSPAVTAALPDARLMQAMTRTLLESGEKFADPPMVATQEAVRSDVNLFAGGLTWIDAEYDERLGEALRPLYQPNASAGLGVALQLRAEVQNSIAKAFFLDSLTLPPAGVKDMTAFEVGQRISEWIRRAMPIFEPMEFEYNGSLCEETFDILMRNGAFGALDDLPQSLRGSEIKFKFESPLHESADRRKGQKFLEAKAALVQAAELDQSVVPMLDASKTLRDVLKSIGTPADWTRDDAEMDQIAQAKSQADQMQATLAGGVAGTQAVKNLGSAAKDFATAGAA